MNTTLAAVLSVLTLLAILAVIHVPLGTWIHRIFTDPHHTRVERFIYRAVGVDPDVEQRWSVYAISVLAFSVVSILVLWLLIMVQGYLPWSLGRPDQGRPPAAPAHRGCRGHHLCGCRGDPEPQRPADDHDDHRRAAGRSGRPGGIPGGDQAARYERWWLLQRQLRPPLREPERVDEPPPDPPRAVDPVRAPLHVRAHGQGPSPGTGHRRNPGVPRLRRDFADGLAGGSRRQHGRQGAAVRTGVVGDLRLHHHLDVHRSSELHARVAATTVRRRRHAEHDAQRAVARRRRHRAVLDARHGHPDGVHRRTDGRPYA